MITFRQHIEIMKGLESEQGISNYLESLEPSERIKVIRDIPLVYPLKDDTRIDRNTLKKFKCYLNVEELVLGQFIMIEQIITGKTNYESSADNDLELSKLIIRPKQQEVFDNEDLIAENKNQEEILNTDVTQVYAVLKTFLDNRDEILFNQFKGVFYEIPDDDEEEEAKEKSGEALFEQQWYWYSMVRMLAKEDITKYAEIYMLKMNIVMPEMSYLAQRNKIESARQRQQAAMRKL